MKIIGGQFKGHGFFMPEGIRPTQSLVRKALFDTLGQDMSGVTFLDLFAGSGAMGLEALSRGADKAVLVEKNPKCADVIRGNIGILPIKTDPSGELSCEVLQMDAFAAVKLLFRQKKQFDIVFVDPPYGRGLAKKALKTVGAYDILHPNCLVVVQHEKREILPVQQGRFLLFRKKEYGATSLTIYKG